MGGKMSQFEFDKRMKIYMAREGFISYPIALMEAENKRDQGWELCNDMLIFDQRRLRPRVFIVDHCTEFRREARIAKWKEKKDGKVDGKGIHGDDHALDEFRYLISLRPTYVRHYNGLKKSPFQEVNKRVRKY
jgi:hypothetical protein